VYLNAPRSCYPCKGFTEGNGDRAFAKL
jgi:hypothetical protein